ncbi:ATP-binding protein [Pseudomonas typographi]|uniref:ATP-binding protein n=1 Tax=Pseudomonas typographi TaxID=2715964 RepID=A0ABR7YVP8_9PSED|nr:ATP-binding protein [Pseudomonas typographi]MBD1552205.1 ATP-binding protein [Pseudomonas typographi]MBD1597224.1 ATP-binding protein [Pseudomonas typographi]
MARMKVQHFGPIREGFTENDGWMDFAQVTVFIGNQGAGKSTLAKLYATFSWLEKAIVRGDHERKWFERKNRFRTQFLRYHRLEHYFSGAGPAPVIEYEGEACRIVYRQDCLHIEGVHTQRYSLPQIMYVPAERNFIAYVKSPKELKLSSDALIEFLVEFDIAKQELRTPVRLPINDTYLDYDRLNDALSIRDEHYKLRLTDASSGFQSAVPLLLVSQHLASTIVNDARRDAPDGQPISTEQLARFRKEIEQIFKGVNMTEELRRAALSAASARFAKSAFINIVEEPEQNLYPLSQWQVLQRLLQLNNANNNNRLVMTSHSPYILNYLNIAAFGHSLKRKIETRQTPGLLEQLGEVIALDALVDPGHLVAYQASEADGTVRRIKMTDGVLADAHDLNEFLREGNRLFDRLLDIEERLPQ